MNRSFVVMTVCLLSMMSTARASVVFFDDFADLDAGDWSPRTASRWQVDNFAGNDVYRLNTSNFSNQSGGRLGEYSLAPTGSYNNFNMNLHVRSDDNINASANSNPDIAAVFGYENDNNYWYAVVNTNPADNQLFQVVNGTRQLRGQGAATIAAGQFYDYEVQRINGNVTVYLDSTAIITATNLTVAAGLLGVGSYNDSLSLAWFDAGNAQMAADNQLDFQFDQLNVIANPEPAAASIIGVGLISLLSARKRRN